MKENKGLTDGQKLKALEWLKERKQLGLLNDAPAQNLKQSQSTPDTLTLKHTSLASGSSPVVSIGGNSYAVPSASGSGASLPSSLPVSGSGTDLVNLGVYLGSVACSRSSVAVVSPLRSFSLSSRLLGRVPSSLLGSSVIGGLSSSSVCFPVVEGSERALCSSFPVRWWSSLVGGPVRGFLVESGFPRLNGWNANLKEKAEDIQGRKSRSLFSFRYFEGERLTVGEIHAASYSDFTGLNEVNKKSP